MLKSSVISFPEIRFIVLAAGGSKRMKGGQKLLKRFHGKPVLQHTLNAFRGIEFKETILVTGFRAEATADLALTVLGPEIKVCTNSDWEEGGLSSSMVCGLRVRSTAPAAGTLMVLGDLPLLQTQTIEKICTEFMKCPQKALRPWQSGNPGHPVVFPESWITELLQVKGDKGGRDLLNVKSGQVINLSVQDMGIHRDIDTQADLTSGASCLQTDPSKDR